MRRHLSIALAAAVFGIAPSALAEEADAEGCKDHPLFNRMPKFRISRCEASQFDLKRFPVGPPKDVDGEPRTKNHEVEGAYTKLTYEILEGQKAPSPLQVMRNFENAAKAAGASVEGKYPDWCKAYVDESLHDGNGCIHYGLTIKFTKGDKEAWAFVESGDEGVYEVQIVEKEEMKQEIVANELLDKLNKDGFVALQIQFDTGKAVIKPESTDQMKQIAKLLESASELKLEVGGHTDDQGDAKANEKLSDARAKAVMKWLTEKGIAAKRLSAKGYGQSKPVADNRSEEGRAKNRRVELVKR